MELENIMDKTTSRPDVKLLSWGGESGIPGDPSVDAMTGVRSARGGISPGLHHDLIPELIPEVHPQVRPG
jgi:hypothetical protein